MDDLRQAIRPSISLSDLGFRQDLGYIDKYPAASRDLRETMDAISTTPSTVMSDDEILHACAYIYIHSLCLRLGRKSYP